MATKLTKKQKDFADAYLETGNGTQSALKAYDTEDPKTASVIAAENLAKPSVQEYLQDKAEIAASIVFDLAQNSEIDQVRLAASKDILDRAGYKAVEKRINVNVDTTASEKVQEAAQKLNELYGRGNKPSDGTVSSPMGTKARD